MPETNSYPTRIKGWINIRDLNTRAIIFEKVPISHMTLRFVLDMVPSANFILNVGVDAVTQKLAEIHERAGEISGKVRIEAFLDLSGQESPDRAWPQASFRVFDGVSTGVGYHNSRGDTSFMVSAAHWLEELDGGAVASAGLTKNSGDNWLAVVGFPTDGGAVNLASSMAVANLGLPANSDLWTDMLRPMLLGVMGYKNSGVLIDNDRFQNLMTRLQSTCSPIQSADLKLGNDRAVEILTKQFNQAKQIIPGKLDLTSLAGQDTANDINRYIRMVLADIVAANIGNTTALDKLQIAASNFRFMLASNVESATLAPITPVLKSSVLWRTITGSEYSFIEGQAFTPRVLAGVALLGRTQLPTDISSPDDGFKDLFPAGAFFAYPRGQTMMFTAPQWLTADVPPVMTKVTLANGRTVGPRNSGNTEALNKVMAKTVAGLRSVGCKFANALWCNEVYRHRSTQVRGRLRFDICPGSTVAVRGVSAKAPQLNADVLYGLVTAVEIHIDAPTPAAFTTLTLSHLRTDQEQDRLPAVHPLFNHAWPGSPLTVLAPQDLRPEKTGT